MEAEEPKQLESRSIVTVKDASGHGYYDQCFFGEGKEWHRTEQEAKDRANRMVEDKKDSIIKQLKRLEKLKF